MKTVKLLLKSRVPVTGLAFFVIAGTVFSGLVQARPVAEDSPRPAVSLSSRPPATLPPGQDSPLQPALTAAFTGDIRAREKILLASKSPAKIKEIKGEVGDFVKKGALVVELDHDLLDAQLKQGEAVLALAEAQLAKLRSGSRAEQIAIAQANLAAAQAQLDLLLEGARKEQIAAAQSALKAAQAKLDLELAGPPPEELIIAELQTKIAEAQDILGAKVREASASAYARGIQPYSTEMSLFQEIVGGLQVQLAQAQLKSIKAPPRPQKIAELEAAVEAAKAQVDLLTLPPRPQQVAQLQAAVEIAKQQLELAKFPITDNDLAAAVAGVVQAQAAFQALKSSLADALLLAPFDGIIAVKNSSPGAMVMPGEPIVTIISAEIEAVFTVGETEFARVKSGQAVSVSVPAYPGQTFAGAIRVMAPQADPATRRFNVYASLSDPESKLRPGMFASVSL